MTSPTQPTVGQGQDMPQDTGVPSGPGSRPTDRASKAVSPVSIPNAALKYAFFTPYHRGFDLVFDFLCAQPEGQCRDGPWSIRASCGYERSRNAEVFAEDQYVGTAHSIIDRFAPIAAAYQRFMFAVETAATEWQADESTAKEAEALRIEERDAALWERVLAASAIERSRPKGSMRSTKARVRRTSPMTSRTNRMTTAGPKAMTKFPSVWRLRHLFDYCAKGECSSSSDGVHYYPARPSGFCSISNRVRCAWLVFTGRADAVIWGDGQ